MSPYLWLQQIILDLFSVAIMLLSVSFIFKAQCRCPMPDDDCCLVYDFRRAKERRQRYGNTSSAEVSIDRANELDEVPVMDEGKLIKVLSPMTLNFKMSTLLMKSGKF